MSHFAQRRCVEVASSTLPRDFDGVPVPEIGSLDINGSLPEAKFRSISDMGGAFSVCFLFVSWASFDRCFCNVNRVNSSAAEQPPAALEE
jgi:hypothetical protein